MEALFPLEPMGETAENIYELRAERPGRRRRDHPRGAGSLRAAEPAARGATPSTAGHFRAEIVPVPVPQRKGEPSRSSTPTSTRATARTDERLRAATRASSSSRKLRPAFRKGGTVTAGNASGMNDGAARAGADVGRARARRSGIRPLARWVASAAAGVDPRVMGLGPVAATRKALARAGLGDRRHRPGGAQRGLRRAGASRCCASWA